MTSTNPPPVRTMVQDVTDRLLSDIVLGAYPAGKRLPAERQLAEELGVSRPPLREALQTLASLGVVRIRRGSGAEVLSRQKWLFGVVPTYFRKGAPATAGGLYSFVPELLRLRAAILLAVVAVVGNRCGPGMLGPVREQAREAHACRSDLGRFVRAEIDMLRTLADLAGVSSAIWLLNTTGEVYHELALHLQGKVKLGDGFLDRMSRVFDLLEQKRNSEALEIYREHFDRADATLVNDVRRAVGAES